MDMIPSSTKITTINPRVALKTVTYEEVLKRIVHALSLHVIKIKEADMILTIVFDQPLEKSKEDITEYIMYKVRKESLNNTIEE